MEERSCEALHALLLLKEEPLQVEAPPPQLSVALPWLLPTLPVEKALRAAVSLCASVADKELFRQLHKRCAASPLPLT